MARIDEVRERYERRTESSTYDVELYASYHSIGEIIDDRPYKTLRS